MQYVFNDRRAFVKTIEFRNTSPILNIEKIRSFRETGVTGSFIKKEFRYSFNDPNFTGVVWQTLNTANLTNINFQDNQSFYLHVRYTRSSVIAGNINTFVLTYDSLTSTTPSGIIDADLLNGFPGLYYLNSENHFGSITNLLVENIIDGSSIGVYNSRLDVSDANTTLYFKSLLSDYGLIITEDVSGLIKINLDPQVIADVSIGFINVGEGSAGVFAGFDASKNVLLRRFVGTPGTTTITETPDLIYIGIDASFSGGQINLAENIGDGEGFYSSKSPTTALLFKSLSSSENTLVISSDTSTVFIDVISGRYLKEASINTAGGKLVWVDGKLDVSIVADVTKVYVDEQLAIRDASITQLFITDVSLKSYFDASLNMLRIYIDGSLARIDSSIAWLIAQNYLKESSLNLDDFYWDGGLLRVSTSVFDSSYAYLLELIIENSTNIGGINYDSSNFIFDGDSHMTSLSNLDTIMGLLAPAKPALLTGQSLVLSNSTVYSAKLPTDLSTLSENWYYESKSAGDTITDYSIDDNFRLTTPNFSSDTFRAGFFASTDTRGTLYADINGDEIVSYDMILGFGNITFPIEEASGLLRFNDESGYGGVDTNFWRKAQAYIDITSQEQGAIKYVIRHTEAGSSNEYFLRYDPNPGLAKWDISPILTDGAISSIYLSGIEHYGINSDISINFIAASGIFRHAYHHVNVARAVSLSYGSTILINPVTVPSYNDNFEVNSKFTFNFANQSSGSSLPQITVSLFKPHVAGDSSIISVSKRLNTYSTIRATDTIEYFTDESKRIFNATGSGGTDTMWDSTNYTIFNPDDGNHAQVQNGTLRYPVSVDYAGFSFTGDKTYIRRFTKSGGLSNGTLTFLGFNPLTDSSAYGFGDVNLILWLTDQDKYFDLGLEFGTGGDASDINNAAGAWTARSSSGISWSLGTFSLGNEDTHTNTFVLMVIFRNTSKSMTRITLT